MLQWFRETRRSDLLVVVTEDSAALVGLVIALAALGATVLFDDPLYDAVGSIAIGTLLVIVALALSAEIKSLLVGESASPRTRLAIRRILEERPEVLTVRSLLTLQQGPDVIVLAQIALRRRFLDTPATAVAACKSALQRQIPEVAWTFIELDLDDHAAASRHTDSSAFPE